MRSRVWIDVILKGSGEAFYA